MYNTRESDEQAQAGLQDLKRAFRRYDSLVARANVLDVDEGSSLAGDRDASGYMPVPDLVENTLGVALDHLHALKVSVEGSGGALLAMASFTLIRTAYEATGTGLWVLQPNSRDERLLRSRRLLRDNRRQVRTLRHEAGSEDPGFVVVEGKLRNAIDARPIIEGQPLNQVDSVTSRLAAIAGMVPDLHLPPLALWRQASGVAHANSYMQIAVLELERRISLPGGVVEVDVTSSHVKVARFYNDALTMVQALLDLYDLRNTSYQRSPSEQERPCGISRQGRPVYLPIRSRWAGCKRNSPQASVTSTIGVPRS